MELRFDRGGSVLHEAARVEPDDNMVERVGFGCAAFIVAA